jgi:hypothetical protein
MWLAMVPPGSEPTATWARRSARLGMTRVDAEMAALLRELAPDPFTVLHGNSAYFLVPK